MQRNETARHSDQAPAARGYAPIVLGPLEAAARAGLRRYRERHLTDRDRLARHWIHELDGDHTYRLDYPLGPDDLVMDVGGYRGQFASDIHGRFGCHVHIYEPLPAFADAIEERFRHNPKVTCHAYGLGEATREERIHIAGDATSVIAASDSTETISIRSAAEEIEEVTAVAPVALLKLNIEGLEFEVLDALVDAGAISGIRFLQIQFHDFVPDAEARRSQLHAQLARTHRLQWDFPFVWESWERSD